MNKEELVFYRKKLALLSKKEEELRSDYLKKLATGEIVGPEIGIPSIDKKWLKNFNIKELYKDKSKKTVYREIYDNNVNHPDDIAIEYFYNKIKFKDLFKNIELAAKSFEHYGVNKGKFVTICSAGIPETVYSFYALSKIGAVANMIAPYFDKNDFVDRINDCQSEILIVMDVFYPEIKDAVKRSNIKKVIIIPSLNSSMLKFLKPGLKLEENSNEITWNQFIKDGINEKDPLEIDYSANIPLVMVYSSGTTGASKGILLSNDSFQNSVQSYPASGVNITRGQKFYQIIPPWYSTGLNTSIHLPLTYGTTVFMDPRFERDVFVKNVIKFKPNYAVAPTSMYEGFLEPKLVKDNDLSFFSDPFEGGEPLRKEVAENIEMVFKNHGSEAKLRTAYGQCECGAAITTQTQKADSSFGSVGFPLPVVNIGIYDKNNNELSYNQRGEIYADTPCGMLNYFKNPEATKEYFYVDEAGVKWSKTGDIGYIDELGNVFICGRASDYSVVNDKQIYNFDLENIIMTLPEIKMCDVLEKKDVNAIATHIIFKDEYKDKININEELLKIQDLIFDKIQDADLVPYVFKIRESFPYAKSGKRNTLAMVNETEDFITLPKYEIKGITRRLTKC